MSSRAQARTAPRVPQVSHKRYLLNQAAGMGDYEFRRQCMKAVTDKYMVVKKLSEGVDGMTYLAISKKWFERGYRHSDDLRSKVRVVKIPILRRDANNFRREIDIYTMLDSARCTPAVAVKNDGAHPYLSIDWERGPTLSRFLDAHKIIPSAFIWTWLADLLSATLEMREGYGVIHDDLHLGNVLVDFQNQHSEGIPKLKVIDFSRAVTRRSSRYAEKYWQDLRSKENNCGVYNLLRYMVENNGDSGGAFGGHAETYQRMRSRLREPSRYNLGSAKINEMIQDCRRQAARAPRWKGGFYRFGDRYTASKLISKADCEVALDKWRWERGGR